VCAHFQFVYRRGDTTGQEIQDSLCAAWNDLLSGAGLQEKLRGQGVDVDLAMRLGRCPFAVAPESDETALTEVAISITMAVLTATTDGGHETGAETVEQLEKILTAYLLPRLFEDHGAHALGPARPLHAHAHPRCDRAFSGRKCDQTRI
jgi:hypothetical protein